MESSQPDLQRITIVVPVYRGEQTLPGLVAEIAPLAAPGTTPGGRAFRIHEVILVHDGAADRSDEVIRELAARYDFVLPVWLSRNYGQHAATLAGMAASSGDWVATLDEDGMFDPADLGRFLDAAIDDGRKLVYGRPRNPPPHGFLRNLCSRIVKRVFFGLLVDDPIGEFSSYRLIDGEIARSLAAFSGPRIYLDVALSWVVDGCGYCDTTHRSDPRPSGYTSRKLIAHMWRLVLSSGTRPLRAVTWLGLASFVAAAAVAGYALWGKLAHEVPIEGWTSLMIAMCWFFGCTLFSLGVMSEYLGATLLMSLGRPLYLVVSKPSRPSPKGGPKP